jgi:hypothetical protein
LIGNVVGWITACAIQEKSNDRVSLQTSILTTIVAHIYLDRYQDARMFVNSLYEWQNSSKNVECVDRCAIMYQIGFSQGLKSVQYNHHPLDEISESACISGLCGLFWHQKFDDQKGKLASRWCDNGPLAILELIDFDGQFYLGHVLLEVTSECVQVDRMPGNKAWSLASYWMGEVQAM